MLILCVCLIVIAGFFTGGALAIRGGRRAAFNSAIACGCLLAVIEGVGIGFQRMMADNTKLEVSWKTKSLGEIADAVGSDAATSTRADKGLRWLVWCMAFPSLREDLGFELCFFTPLLMAAERSCW